MNHYRIIEFFERGMKRPRFYIEKKGWFFWHKLKRWETMQYGATLYFNSAGEALSVINKLLEEDLKECYSKVIYNTSECE